MTSAPTPTRAQRRATAAPSGSASRRSPGVLEVVQRGADRTRERGAPLELEERRRDVRRQADAACRRAGRGGRRGPAGTSSHSGAPSRPQPGARRPGSARSSAAEARRAERGHGAMMAVGRCTGLIRRVAVRSSRSPPGRSGRRPTVPVRSIVPTGQLEDAGRATDERHEPGPRRSPRWTDTTGRTLSRAGSGLPEEDGVDREAHEHHVDAVRPVSHRPAPAVEARPAHQAHEPGPQAVRDLEAVARGRWRG